MDLGALPKPVKLELRVLGALEVWQGNQRLHVGHRKTLALLAFLALEGQTARSALSALFWSDNTEEEARRNLRRELHRLREAGLRDHLEASNDQLRLVGLSATDVQRFEVLVAEGQLEGALLLWRGELLAGLRLENAPEFDSWLETRREALASTLRKVQLEQAERLEVRGDWHAALKLNQQVLNADRLQERQHREVMRLQYLLGQREAALAQFEDCKTMLRDELGLEPLPETLHLAQQIRAAQSLTPNIAVQLLEARPLTVPLIGRADALVALSSSRTPLTLVLAEAGGGKTFLLEAAAPHSLRVRFKAVSSQTPLYAFAEAIREGLRNLEAQTKFEALLPIWQLEAARLVPELSKTQSSQAQERSLLLEGLARVLECLTDDRLILEDLHWADPASLELLAHLVRRTGRAAQQPRLIATARGDELSAEADQMLESLSRDGFSTRITLPALSEIQASELVRSLGGPTSPAFSSQLFKVTAGNPFFILETIRYFFEQTELGMGDAAWVGGLPIPPSVLSAVLNRVDRLGSVAKRLLETAALTEDGFALEEIQPATALGEWEGLEGLEQAVKAQILKRNETGLGFTHDLVRQALHTTLSLERQRLIHAKLAVSLEQVGAPPARVAMHLEQSGKAIAAVIWRIKAAEQATQVYAHTQALEQYDQALGNGASGRVEFAIQFARSELFATLGQTAGRQQALEAMRDIALDLGDVRLSIQSQLAFLRFFNYIQQYDQVVASAGELIVTKALEPLEKALALIERSNALIRLGQLTASKNNLQQALELGLTLGSGMIGRIHSYLRTIALIEGDLQTARQQTTWGLAALSAPNNLAGKLEAMIGMARISAMQGDPIAAIQSLEATLLLARQHNLLPEQQFALIWLVENQLRLHQLGQAQMNIRQTLEIIHISQDKLWSTKILSFQTQLLSLIGKPNQALANAQMVLEQSKNLGYAPQVVAFTCLAVLYLQFGQITIAKRHYRKALKLSQESNSFSRICSFQTGLARCALSQHDTPKAAQHLKQAFRFMAQAEQIEQDDAQLLRAKIWMLIGRYAPALAIAQSLKNSVFPGIHLQALALELEAQLSLGLKPALAPALQALESNPPLLPSLELRHELTVALEKSGQVQAALNLRCATKTRLLELAATLKDHPDLKQSFLELHADLV